MTVEAAGAVRRQRWSGTVFSTWVVLGLFLDGWAHNAGKPEDFWTPWHAVLYSGLVVGGLWFVRERRRLHVAGEVVPVDPLVIIGFAAFGVAGAGDAVWHTVFGVEEDVAALLSPTHLALMVGGLLLVTSPLRRPDAEVEVPDPEASWRTFAPNAVAVLLAVAVVAFFLQFVSAFHLLDTSIFAGSTGAAEDGAVHGVTSVLVTNLLLLAGVGWVLTRWPQPPAGTITLLVGGPALLLSSLLAFDDVALAAAPLAAGVAGDLLVRRGAGRGVVLLAVPGLTWPLWFALVAASTSFGWEVELWTGTIVFAVLTGAALELLVRSPTAGREAQPAPQRTRAARQVAQPVGLAET